MPKYRLIRKSYINSIENEDGPGSLRNCVQRDGGTETLWSGELDTEPDSKWFYEVGIEIGDDDDDYGYAEYRYILEELKDGEWAYCADLSPYEPPVAPSSPYWDDHEDFNDEDEIPDNEQEIPYWEDPEWIAEQERLAADYRAKHGH